MEQKLLYFAEYLWHMKIQENISLKPFTTFGIDKKAEFFTIISSLDELKEALKLAKKNLWPVFILGGGSNILLTKDVKGLVLKLELKGISLIKEEGDLGGWEGKMQYYKKNKKFEDGADRLGALVQKHEVFRKLILCPEILSCA